MGSDAPAVPSAFDALAAGYDAGFTESLLGELLRAAVWRRLDPLFDAGDHVLELGCGTGEDAVHLARRGVEVVGVDASAAMVEAARRKAEEAGVSDRLTFAHGTIEAWAGDPGPPGAFDGVLSNFGALNCVTDLRPVASALASVVRPGGRVVLVVMGPLVPWEWLWHLAHLAPRKAFRRLRPGGVEWRSLKVWYPSPGTVARVFRPAFRKHRLSALGALLPTSEAGSLAARFPRVARGIARLERRLERLPPLPWLADHYVLELERNA